MGHLSRSWTTTTGARPRIMPGIIGLLTVPVLAVAGVLPLPLGSISLPPGLLVLVGLAGIAAWIAKGSSAGWLGYGLGLAAGTLGALFVVASFASSMTVENWLVSADVFRVNLALTVILVTVAAAIGYAAGALITRRLQPDPAARPALLAITLPLVAMAAVALGYPLIVPERALLTADAPTGHAHGKCRRTPDHRADRVPRRSRHLGDQERVRPAALTRHGRSPDRCRRGAASSR